MEGNKRKNRLAKTKRKTTKTPRHGGKPKEITFLISAPLRLCGKNKENKEKPGDTKARKKKEKITLS
jgi:hypothetical protein